MLQFRGAEMYNKLSQYPLFMTLSEESRKKISKLAKQKKYKRGEFLVKENESNEHLFLLLEGTVRIESNLGELIAILKSGSIIGEISTTSLSLPIANAIASSEVNVVVIPIQMITELSNQELDFENALRELGMQRVMSRLLES